MGYDMSKQSKLGTFPSAGKWCSGILYLLFFTSCAYFNTFYNAQNYFRSGLALMETAGRPDEDKIPLQAAAAFDKAITKSLKVIEKYPESKLIDDALFILGRSHYYRQEYGLAERYFTQLLNEFVWLDYADQVRLWLAKVHAEMGLYETMEADLAPILEADDPPRDLLTEIFILRGDLAVRRQETQLAIRAYEAGALGAATDAQRAAIYHKLYNLALAEEDLPAALQYLEKFTRTTPNETERVEAQLGRIRLMQQMGAIKAAYKEIRKMETLAEYSSIIPGLRLEIGKIEYERGNVEIALERFGEIIEEYGTLPEASEAAFRAGEIQLVENQDTKEARVLLRKVRVNTLYYQAARAKLNLIDTIEKLVQEITKLEEQLAVASQDPEKGGEPDSTSGAVDTLAIHQQLAYAKYRLGETRLLDMRDRETGLELMAEIVTRHPASDVAAQAAYVLYYHTEDNQDQAEFWRAVLLEQYPNSAYSLLLSDPAAESGSRELDYLMSAAARAVIYDPRHALEIFQTIRRQFGTEQSSFAIAYLYDEYLAELDSAIMAYEENLLVYPHGKYSRNADRRLKELRAIKLGPESGSVTATTEAHPATDQRPTVEEPTVKLVPNSKLPADFEPPEADTAPREKQDRFQ